jgi:hypothetical protein
MESKMKIFVSIFTLVLLIMLCAGCTNSDEKVNLSISNFHFCSAIRDSGDYDIHGSTYTNGELVYMYFELKGYAVQNDSSTQIYQTLTVKMPNGTALIMDDGVPVENYVMIDQSINTAGKNFIWFDNHLWEINETWSKGTYNVSIFVEDRVGKKSVTYATEFTIN